MMMRGDEAGIDHAAGRVDDPLVRLPLERADRGDASIAETDRAARAHRIARQAGEDPLRAGNERHASAPTSLSCHAPSASFDRPTMMVNRPTPASVMRNSAANMRGI